MTEWLAQYEEDGSTYFRIGRDGDDVIAEWIGTVRLVARRDGNAHRFERDRNAHPADIAKIERGSARMLLRHLEGKLSLHGAAIERGGHAIVLLGRAMQGKSTLAAGLCADEGVGLLSDDAVAIDPALVHGYEARPFEELHWLDANARRAITGMTRGAAGIDVNQGSADATTKNDKSPVPAARTSSGGRIVAFVDLVFADGPVRLLRTSPLEAMSALVPQVVRFVLDDPEVHRKELDALGRLVDEVPVFRLERPRRLAVLSESCDRIFSLLSGPTNASSDT